MKFIVINDTRAEKLGQYICRTSHHCARTVEYFNVSKSAVHKDVTADLKRITTGLYGEINAVLQENNEERHLSVGVATKRKYEKKRREKNWAKALIKRSPDLPSGSATSESEEKSTAAQKNSAPHHKPAEITK